jgi:hypothetical protein
MKPGSGSSTPSQHLAEVMESVETAEAMESVEMGNDQMHELLEAILDRMDCIQGDVKRIDSRAALAAEPNLPVDPNYVNMCWRAIKRRSDGSFPWDLMRWFSNWMGVWWPRR